MLRAVFRAAHARRHAAAVAAATIGATGSAIAYCEAAKETVPPFVLGGDKYNQNEFSGRLQKINEMINPLTVMTSDEDLHAAQEKLKRFKELGRLPDGVTDQEMWDAQGTVDAIIHGPTGDKMFIPGRMSMFVPMNLIPTSGMVMARSTPAILFWQWMNQTYNVVNNYTCRAGPEVAMGPLAQSYALAVTASCTIAIGFSRLLKAYPRLQTFGILVPYFAVISAGSCNVAFTRMDEIQNGIDVADRDGTIVGRSIAAGRQAVFQTVTTRSMFIPLISLVGPPLFMKGVYATGVLAAGGAAAMAVEVGAVAVALAFGLPIALSIQPLQMELDVTSLEPQFHALQHKDGSPIRQVYASKGL
jgi:tricarboxylate carrier